MLLRRVVVASLAALAVALPAVPAPADPGSDRGRGAGRSARATPPLAPAARDALTRALARGRLSEAEYALERARSIFDLRRARQEHGDVERPDPHHVTLLLRDLALRLNDLDGTEREIAEYLLARPDDNASDPSLPGGKPPIKYGSSTPSTHICSGDPNVKVCVHHVDQPGHPHHATAEQAALTLGVLEEVWTAQVGPGLFRAPKADHKGPDDPALKPYLDVYLADVGASKVYGYCTSDDPNLRLPSYRFFDFSAYCVLDNDYIETFFGPQPLETLKVTAAHEFFHAVQFAYDIAEDFWLMEGTAVAIEDHVYDDINDNYQFLATSQFRRPQIPVDLTHGGNEYAFMHRYGAWIFWRFMSEHLSPNGSPDIQVLRRVWERADASGRPAAPDDYSLRAAVNVSRERGVPFRKLFADYGVALRVPEMTFVEGTDYLDFLRSNNASRKTIHRDVLLRPAARRAVQSTVVNHLSHKFVRIRKRNASNDALLRVIVDLPRRKKGPVATLLRFQTNGNVISRRIRLDWRGDGRLTVPFRQGTRQAVVVLTNASTRFKNCYQPFPLVELSCGGDAVDDGLTYKVTARLLN